MDSNEAVPGEDSQQIQSTPDKPTEPTDNNNNNTDPKTTLTSDQEEGDNHRPVKTKITPRTKIARKEKASMGWTQTKRTIF